MGLLDQHGVPNLVIPDFFKTLFQSVLVFKHGVDGAASEVPPCLSQRCDPPATHFIQDCSSLGGLGEKHSEKYSDECVTAAPIERLGDQFVFQVKWLEFLPQEFLESFHSSVL